MTSQPQSPPAGDTELTSIIDDYGLENWSYKQEFIDKVNAYILAEVLKLLGDNVEEYPQDGAAQYGQRVGYNRAKDELRQAATARFGKGEA